MVQLLRAVAEPTRLRIVALLAECDLTVKDITAILGQSQPRISRHLKLLADAQLVSRTAEGAFAFYRLAERGAAPGVLSLILGRLDPNDAVLRRDGDRLAATRAANAAAAADYFAANAHVWDRIRSLHAPEAEVEAVIGDLLGDRAVGRLLDIGTGTGRMLELMAPHARQMLGVDASAAMLAVARANLAKRGVSNARLAQDDVYALSVPADAFDTVIVHQVLHYLDDPARAVREAARTLRPGGRLLVVDFAPHAMEELRTVAQHRRLGIADADLKGWLAVAGLDLLRTQALDGEGEGLTVSLWLAKDPRFVADDVRPAERVFA